MEIRKAILNPNTNKYYTGRFWDVSWSFNWEDARLFKDEAEITELLKFDDEDKEKVKYLFDEIDYIEVRTFYVA